ncbi:uncharacterized protein LOC125649607 isoform X2 [Ostrea edulis]|uniref:uncharacterized protein LOC125649607 isoform X2 n=1 Tax=Ostrea edulis TaxID=37623 RepID=UPI0020961259|nr:uncharacterized protein LOC125649607 isoform X2 [Ostrea edulis]
MESQEERKRRLYGPSRNLKVQEIREKLSKSCVLKDGEYNLTANNLKEGIFDTSYTRDYPGASLDPSFLPEQHGQLDHHFYLGNDSGEMVPAETYQQSTTKSDFTEQSYSKPKTLQDPGIINWPDMAPRYMVSRKMADSEYKSSYIPDIRDGPVPPLYPRVNTSKLKLPLDPEKFWRQRGTNIKLGSDVPQLFSEHQRVYGVGREGPPDGFIREKGHMGKEVSRKMKDMAKHSHVFRMGDYNGIVGNFQTTVNDEFGPRTLPPAEHAARALKAAQIRSEKKKDSGENGVESSTSSSSLPDDHTRVNHLTVHARQTTVPKVFKDAADERTYQTAAHFQFGSDPNTIHTVYGKDFAPGSMTSSGPPQKCLVPDAGRLLQNDPAYASMMSTSNQADFSYTPAMPTLNAEGKTQMEVNIERRHTDNVIFSFDRSRHTADRQTSLAHTDFRGPPPGYRPMEPMSRPEVEYDYLTPNDALPYPPPENRTSEAKNNYIGTFMSGGHALDRRHSKNTMCKSRLEDGRSTHFTVGYNPMDFSSETHMKFQGNKKNDSHIAPAGKTETNAAVKFKHVSISENTQDLKAADPFTVSKQESLIARAAHLDPPKEHAFTTSVMKADYPALHRRGLTDAQWRMVQDTDQKNGKAIANSHLFHTDNSGRNNFVSTAMDDFIKPEVMTGGRKLLAAR